MDGFGRCLSLGSPVADPETRIWVEVVYFGRRRQWHPTPVLLPGKSHGQRSLVGCSPWGHEELDMTERLHFHFSFSCIGEGNGNPLQCSCLENPRDWGAWWAAVYGVAQSQTWLKWLSSSSLFWERSQENTFREWKSDIQKGRKSIKSVLTSKLQLELLDSFLLGHHGRENCFKWQARHWGIYPPSPHRAVVEGWIQGFWLVLHMAPTCSTSRELPKQWAALILEECQRIGAGMWQLLPQQVTPSKEGSC